ncbi:unnamed protein product [Lactuca saligna]|uniref:Uncharacterized protein n=1 Tax=Lactuca saligna TaxID=75948 RepID=A0AA36E0H0_LACSI|nr:unnamed protein product [Lactuca saligna]
MQPATPRKKLSMLPPLLGMKKCQPTVNPHCYRQSLINPYQLPLMPVAWVSSSIQSWIVYQESCWIKAAVLILVVLFGGRYEKLQRWDDALKAYTAKSAQATSQQGNSYCSVFIPNPKFFGWRKGSQELSEQGFNISLKEV